MKTSAIVLHALKYGESQLIVDLFTRDAGRVSFFCHLPKSNKGKIKKQLFQPLTLLEVVFDYRPQASMQRFRDLRLAKPFGSVPFDPVKLSISLFLAEFLNYATRNEQQNELLYDYVEDSLLWLDNVSEQYANFHLVFMMRLSLFVGFFPNLDKACDGAFFDFRAGCFVRQQPLHPDFLPPADAARLRVLMRMTFDNMHLFAMSRVERNLCVDFILKYYRLHFPDFPEMKSLDVMKSLFA